MSILLCISFMYACFTGVLVVGWFRMEQFQLNPATLITTRVTVIIPARNEANTLPFLLQDINNQDFPREYLEVLVMNDASTDQTAEVVEGLKSSVNYQLRLVNVDTSLSNSPKKRAITQGISLTSSDLIITTDADCRVGIYWLRLMVQYYQTYSPQLISAPVTFVDDSRPFTSLQIVEFASLVGSGAVSMFLQKPSMCNGANLAYTKKAFEEVNGFEGSEQLASGDDEFLMHKIFQRFPDQVLFLKNNEVIVKTSAQQTLHSFVQQRKRWASKWQYYQNWQVTALAIFIFCVNFGLIIGLVGASVGYFSWKAFVCQVGLKLGLELIFLQGMLRFLGHGLVGWWIPITQLIYPIYVSFFGLLAQKKGYEWKGRRLN